MPLEVNCRDTTCDYSEEVDPSEIGPRCPECGAVLVRTGSPTTPEDTKSDKA